MGRRFLIIVAAAMGLSWPAGAQPAVNALLDRLKSVDPAKATPADCETQVTRAARLNAPDLLYGAQVCFAVKRPVEGSFLLNAGQTRAITDLGLMVPATKADSDASTALYGVLYFYAGGPGDAEVLLQPASRARLFRLLDGWSPAYGPDYDPGWGLRRRPDDAAYRAAIAEAKAYQQRHLADVVTLYADASYAALEARLDDLQRRNPRGFVVGTPDGKESSDLMRRMSARAVALGVGTAPAVAEDVAAADQFPPAARAADEVPAADSGPTAQHCADLAERMTIAQESRIVAVLVTQSRQWGTIWRADLAAPNRPIERLTCTQTTTSSRPLKMGSDSLAPLSP